jgi:hypothetical protein
MHSYPPAHCVLQGISRGSSGSPFTGRVPFLASPFSSKLANASGRIEFIIVLIMDWSFASGCSPPRLSTTQLPSATDRPVFLSDRDSHPTVGAYSQAHLNRDFVAEDPYVDAHAQPRDKSKVLLEKTCGPSTHLSSG